MIAEKLIFEFSNLIGSFVVYSLIQAMNSDNYRGFSPKIQNEISNNYINKAISHIIWALIPRFKDFINKPFGHVSMTTNEKEIKLKYFFTIEKIIKLLKAFKKIYPFLTY